MPEWRDDCVQADVLPFHFGQRGGAWPSARPRTAVVVGHPGHELRVYGCLELLQPTVFVLTDGSGQSGQSRLVSTLKVLERAGATAGSFCGRFTDRALYDSLLHADWQLFAGLADELARALVRERIELVACDAIEGFCSVHETAHLLAQAAVRAAQPHSHTPITLAAFPVVERPWTATDMDRTQDLWLELADETLYRKMHLAKNYHEIADEVDKTVECFGLAPFRVEGLRRVDPNAALAAPPADPPFYERHGQEQVLTGAYSDVITYRAHILPLAQRLLGRRSERRAA